MKLIAIVGKKRSGKDTCADYLINDKGAAKYQLAQPIKQALWKAWSIKFSERKELFPTLVEEDFYGVGEWDRERSIPFNNRDAIDLFHTALDFLGRQYRLQNPFYQGKDVVESVVLNNNEPWNIRRFMQTLGTDIVVDQIDRMFWMKLFADEYFDSMKAKYDSAVGEFKYFVVPDVRQEHEIDALRAMGATIIHVVRPDTDDSYDQHITEAGLPIHETDTVVVNNGTLDQLFVALNKAIK